MIEYTMAQDEIYELEGYFERKYTKQIVDQINNFEFPDDWTPKQVIDYITYKIDRE
jgi:hypothetical protein